MQLVALNLLKSCQEVVMKIDPNMIIGGINANRPVSGAKGVAGGFEDLLKGIEQQAPAATNSVQGLRPMDMLSPQKIMAMSLSDQALDMLGEYASALQDPSQTLKDLAAKVGELQGIKSDVDNAAVAISPDDPLKSIMDEVSASLETEIVRFTRGDLSS